MEPGTIGGIIAGVIVGIPSAVVATKTILTKALKPLEKELRNGHTGAPVDHGDTLRVAVDEIRNISRDTSRIVTTVLVEQQEMRGEIRDLTDRVDKIESK